MMMEASVPIEIRSFQEQNENAAVEIARGPLAGMRRQLLRSESRCMLTTSIPSLPCSVVMHIPLEWVHQTETWSLDGLHKAPQE